MKRCCMLHLYATASVAEVRDTTTEYRPFLCAANRRFFKEIRAVWQDR